LAIATELNILFTTAPAKIVEQIPKSDEPPKTFPENPVGGAT